MEPGDVIRKLKDELHAAKARTADLEAELRECQRDNRESGMAAHEALLDELEEWIVEQRGE